MISARPPAPAHKRKRISPATLLALNGAVAEEHCHLPSDSPRVQLTLPRLSILETTSSTVEPVRVVERA
jgi:hypothetical protein